MSQPSRRACIQHTLIGVLLTLSAGIATAQTVVSQSPLSVSGNVPGNLLLVPSVEWPTVDSLANLDTTYNNSRIYVGYFDSAKCYLYHYDATTETNRYFYPVSIMASMHPTGSTAPTPGTCDGVNKQWSGNFLNWAVTQTIDPFRKALTGGYRVRDTATETWLEKARYDGNGGTSIFPDRVISSSASSYVPVGAGTNPWTSMTIRVRNLGNKLRFTNGSTGVSNLSGSTFIAYDPTTNLTTGTGGNSNTVFEVSVRVKVCDSSIGSNVSQSVEPNCVQYSQGWKPEGLIQKYASRIRYSVFGYLNDQTGSPNRDGGALRAQQKFVGPYKRDPVSGVVTNSNVEWNTTTGQLIQNPDTADATATTTRVGQTIADSGVINYINKFGEMTTANHKSYDPVSELYYAAIRYLKNQGNVAAYTDFPGTASSAQKYILADGFPVITTWDDPIQYYCQNNAILGIGDVNTWWDKNLPGNTVRTDEPGTPSEVSGDNTVNVVTALAKVAALEGITAGIPTPFNTGRDNSAYIAALAYDSHTKDMRSDKQGSQTVSTYWVDVREASVLQSKNNNQYYLAAKYGGFTVPDGFDPYSADNTALAQSLWNSAGDTLSTGDLRPDNFFVASEADKMVESLTRAFAKISAESQGSASSLAANSTRIDTNTRTFQAQFFSGTWRGELKSFRINSDRTVATTPEWVAGASLLSAPWSNRNIYTYDGSSYVTFRWSNLSAAEQSALGSQTVVDYLRGNRAAEESQPGGTLRTRTGVLGDIVDSTPVYVGQPNARLYSSASFTGASSYGSFVTSSTVTSRPAMLYVGANDGMLHAFNASTGAEVYAYVPKAAILNNLASYSDPDYQHKYFVDGEIAVADVYDTSATAWKTVLVGTMGRGGPGIFALDITNPSNVQFLWEKSGTDIPALGKNIGLPVIAQVADGDWRVVLGNGPESSGGTAKLISIGIFSGTATVADTNATTGNGLTAVLARDMDSDGFAETAFAGDLKGNLWKITGYAGASPTVLKEFTATDASSNAQPITAAPLVGKDPTTGNTWIFFGTGQYLNDTDTSNTRTQTWYGLIDGGTAITGRSELVSRVFGTGPAVTGFAATRTLPAGSTGDFVGKRGWYIDLPASGERMVLPNRFEGTALIGTSRIPSSADVCKPAGKSFIMSIDPFTGGKLSKPFFDLNNDGQNNDENVSAVGFDDGANGAIFVSNGGGDGGGNLLVPFDNGDIGNLGFFGAAVQAKRMSWRELVN